MSGDLVVHRRGPLFEAVGASMCLPGVFAPVPRDERLLVDGGRAQQPAGPADGRDGRRAGDRGRRDGAVPATRSAERHDGAAREHESGHRGRDARWSASTTPLPSLKETLTRAIGIGSVDAVELARRRADLLITPETGVVGLLDFEQIDRMVELGRRAAGAALEATSGFPGD